MITYRVAHLIEQGVPPGSILAVTFTNKAAGVMKDRISELLRASGRSAFGRVGLHVSFLLRAPAAPRIADTSGFRAISRSTMTTTRPRP